MKKISIIFLMIFTFFISINNVKANSLSSININANILENGTMHIKEIWSMKTNKDTEIYKEEYNLGNISITNFSVSDEKGKYILQQPWNINASFDTKKNRYGINRVSKGVELCWGISEYGNKTYTIEYDMENAVFNTNDSQVLYLRLINDLAFPPEKFNITISGPTKFENTLDVWGYGYKGYAYVNNGVISMSNGENTPLSKGNYAVLLVKFPLNTFNVSESNTYSKYPNFDSVLENSKEGSFSYNYENSNKGILEVIFLFLGNLIRGILPLIIILGIIKVLKNCTRYKFGKAGGHIDMSKINMFRDIPCDKNIYKAYFVSQAYKLNRKNTDFFGTIFLKWLNDDKVRIIKTEKNGLFGSKEITSIDLTNFGEADTTIENKLVEMLKEASENEILDEKEFEKYSKNNYKKVFKWFEDAESYGRKIYEDNSLVTQKGKNYIIDDRVKNDAIELAGLKKYLKEFSRMETKQPMEVKLWKEYLMFAQIFGMADEIAKQFKKLYPEVLTEMNASNYDIGDIILLNHFSNTAVASASSARSAAESYSSGGGGFSSGGGGGGSFGGGGGGSR